MSLISRGHHDEIPFVKIHSKERKRQKLYTNELQFFPIYERGFPCVNRLLQIAKSRFPEHFHSNQIVEQVVLVFSNSITRIWPRKKMTVCCVFLCLHLMLLASPHLRVIFKSLKADFHKLEVGVFCSWLHVCFWFSPVLLLNSC
jgi:hypothetical protein